jgi:hypothetical protein
MFDQEARHASLWSFIRENNWEAVESMLVKKVIVFYDGKIIAKIPNVVNFLESLFSTAGHNILVPNAFVYRPGLTKGTILMEGTEIGTVHRNVFYKSAEGSTSSDSNSSNSNSGSESGGSESGSSGSESGDDEGYSESDDSVEGKIMLVINIY